MIDKVKIDQVTYAVSETAGPILVDSRVCRGAITYGTNKIELLATEGESQKQVTLMHEIVHGIVYERNLEKYIKGDENEDFTDEMARAIMQLIRDNPELVKQLNS